MSIHRFITKQFNGSKLVESTRYIGYFNQASRRFCVVKEEDVNSPEISDEDNDGYFQSLTQKSLLNDDNVQSNRDSYYQHQQQEHYRRLMEKRQKNCQYDSYPEIFRKIDTAISAKEIKEYVIDYIASTKQQFNLFDAIETISQYAKPTDDEIETEDIKEKSELYGPRKPAVFTHGIRGCFAMKQYEIGWDLYNIAREKNYVSNDLYSLALFGKMRESPSMESLRACFKMFDEWKDEEKNGGLPINAKIYASLISSCMKIRHFGKAFHVYNNLILKDLDKATLTKILKSSSVRQEIVNLYCKSQGVNAAVKFVSDCKVEYGVLPTQNILTTLIAGCAAEIRENPQLLDIAERLFKTAFDVIQGDDNKVGLRLFSSLMVVYSKIGDYQSCIDLLHQMQTNDNWPNPNQYCIAPALKAISIHNVKLENENKKLTSKEKWKLIEEILEIQKKNNLSNDVIIYSVLFHSCDGDIDKMMKLYETMSEIEKIRPNQMALQNILLGGLDGYIQKIKQRKENNHDISKLIDHDVTEFIDWVLMEMKKYNLSVSETFRYRLKTKLDIIKEIQHAPSC